MVSGELYVKKIARISKKVDKVSISFKFKSIDEFKELDKDSNLVSVVILYEIMKVSHLGYYKWNLKSLTPIEYRNQAV